MKNSKDTSHITTGSNLLDRTSCFSIVAAAVKDVVPDSVVDLRSPEVKTSEFSFNKQHFNLSYYFYAYSDL